MKILIDLTSLADNFSGIERFALCITKEMINTDNKNIDYILIFKNSIYKEFISIPSNVKIIVFKGKNKLLFNQIKLPLMLMKQKADIYFFPAFPAPFFFFNKNAINVIHDVGCWDCPSKNKKYMTLYFKIMYKKAAFGKKMIVTVSEFSRRRIAEVLKKELSQISVVYNGLSDCFDNFVFSEVTNEKVINNYKLPSNYILCLSTLEPRKNIRLLIDAYNDLLTDGKINIDLVLAGRKGWMIDDLMENISKSTVDRIHFTGFVEDDLLPYVYKNASLFVFPSVYEGFGVPPIEAMAMEVPVVSSNAASLPEVLGDAALMFPSGDKEALKKRILKVLSLSDNEKQVLLEKGQIQAHLYNWNKEAKKLKNVLKSYSKESE